MAKKAATGGCCCVMADNVTELPFEFALKKSYLTPLIASAA